MARFTSAEEIELAMSTMTVTPRELCDETSNRQLAAIWQGQEPIPPMTTYVDALEADHELVSSSSTSRMAYDAVRCILAGEQTTTPARSWRQVKQGLPRQPIVFLAHASASTGDTGPFFRIIMVSRSSIQGISTLTSTVDIASLCTRSVPCPPRISLRAHHFHQYHGSSISVFYSLVDAVCTPV